MWKRIVLQSRAVGTRCDGSAFEAALEVERDDAQAFAQVEGVRVDALGARVKLQVVAAQAHGLVKDLQGLGCSVISLRGAALLALAAVMPAGPLSDLTGISVGVANRWQTLAAAAYSGYPALRPK